MKLILFVLGVVLAACAFLAAGAEMAARVIDPELPVFPGFGAVWRTVSPATWEAFLAHPAAPHLLGVMAAPGWLLLGAPGLALIVAFRKRDPNLDLAAYEESLFLFDELAKRAREEGYTDLGDDITPSDYADLDLADESYASDSIADDLLGDIEATKTPSPPSADPAPGAPPKTAPEAQIERETP